MSRNPRTVLKENAVLKAQLAAERRRRAALSDGLDRMIAEADRLGKQVERCQAERRGGAR
jgi:hypothetical protein